MDKLMTLMKKYKSLICYGIFGVLTTLINIFVYHLLYNEMGWSNVVSNICAWVLSVLFAFITNKIWVFESKTLKANVLIFEVLSFFGCRLATGLLDLAIMYVTVDRLALSGIFMKCISNVIVIIVNYAASKMIIFKKQED